MTKSPPQFSSWRGSAPRGHALVRRGTLDQQHETAGDLARRIDAAARFINGMVVSGARAPFDGIKKSGYGRGPGSSSSRSSRTSRRFE